MQTPRNLVLASALALSFVASPALAENATPAPSAPPLPVPYAPYVDPGVGLELTGNEPMKITVYAEDDRPLFTCRTPCRVRIYPGKYRFHVSGGPQKIESDTVADVRSSERLSFSLADRSEKNGFLAMAITGTALIPVGATVAFAAAMANACFDCSPQEERSHTTPAGVYIGLGMLVAGAIMTPVGWSSFAHNRKPQYESTPVGVAAARPQRRARSAPARLGFAVAPTPGGASAGLWGSF